MNKTLMAIATCAALLAGGCSVYMAAAGDEEPNLSNVHRGATRGEIEMALGQPKSLSTQANGDTVATYEYTVGNEPSTGRASGTRRWTSSPLGLGGVGRSNRGPEPGRKDLGDGAVRPERHRHRPAVEQDAVAAVRTLVEPGRRRQGGAVEGRAPLKGASSPASGRRRWARATARCADRRGGRR